MPLRSVEAATRDDAIAAAREQFGPSARVVGVRRVRSGGVLGFFATERYVAEVANDPAGRPAVPATTAARLGDSDRAEEPAAGYTSSPLSAAAPATAAPSSAGARSRAAAPSRNGAAAWAAAAGTPAPTSSSSPSYSSSSSSSSSSGVDEERVSELAGLLGAESAPATPAAPLYGRTSFPRTPAARPATPVVFPAEKTVDDSPFVEDYVASRPLLRVDEVTAAPSPFTAALARMVSGDRDVREAVENALDKPAIRRARSDAAPSVSQSSSPRSDNTSVPSPSARQEEETVGDQVMAPPSPEAPLAAELPNWAVEPEAAAGGSPREEAIAEVLRSALAQGHSDEALAGILRKVLAGDSPQSALSSPVVAPEPAPAPVVEYVASEPVPAEPGAPAMSLAMALAGASATLAQPEPEPEPELVVEETVVAVFATPVEAAVVEEPAVEEPAVETGTFEAPTDATPTDEMPADEAYAHEVPAYLTPGYEVAGYEVPVFPLPPVLAPASYVSPSSIWGSASDSIWGPSIDSIWGGGTSSETPLWGHSGLNRPAPFTNSDAPIWDSVARAEQVSSNDDAADAVDDLPVFDAVSTPTAADGDDLFAEPTTDVEAIADVEGEAADEVVEPTTDVEAIADVEGEAADEVVEATPEIAVLAPVLARTASDPAPMSLDATTVMPPLSLLPPLPGSRPSRGRPPVPPSTSRRQAPTTQPHVPSTSPMSATPAAPSVGTPAVESEAPAAQPPAESTESPLATVTRLPVAPLMAVAETPDLPDMFAEVEVEATEVEATEVEATEVEAAVAVDAPIVDEPVAAEPVVEELAVVEQPVVEAVDDQPVVEEAVVERVAEEPAAGQPTDIVARLEALGVPGHLLGSDFAADVRARGTYAALTRALGGRLPKAPDLPTGPGEVLLVVGPGVETLRAARSLAASLRLDPDRVQWATRGDLAGLAPKGSRVTTVDAAIDRRQDFAHEGTVTIVAVDAPMRTDAYWTAQMLAVWSPTAVWAVVEATRKPEDLGPWIDGLPRVDALMVQDTDLSADPAAVLRRVATPVAMIDGGRATAHRWASLLCERLENVRP